MGENLLNSQTVDFRINSEIFSCNINFFGYPLSLNQFNLHIFQFVFTCISQNDIY